ncbi:hypothetical protein BOTU111922_17645 [Bordetella tumulicola]
MSEQPRKTESAIQDAASRFLEALQLYSPDHAYKSIISSKD